MKVRRKLDKAECSSLRFNTHGLSEIIVMYPGPNPDMDSDFIKNYDVYLEQKQEWKDMAQAFKDKDLITDNYNTTFFEPNTKEDRERGFRL